MTVIIRDGNFIEDEFIAEGGAFIQHEQLSALAHDMDPAFTGIDIQSDTDPQSLAGLMNSVAAIRVNFPTFADGRGFSIARQLRRMGFNGLLRAYGHVLADQYPLALRSGFDEVEILNRQAGRQPQTQWQDTFRRVENNYLDRLKAGEVAA